MNINATMDKRAALEVSVTKLNEAILANSAHEVIEKQMNNVRAKLQKTYAEISFRE